MAQSYSAAERGEHTGDMRQMSTQFMSLQNSIQQESRKYQTLSNASKARHDIAKSAIQNMRA